jgi:hypothetical protein
MIGGFLWNLEDFVTLTIGASNDGVLILRQDIHMQNCALKIFQNEDSQ